MRGGSHGDWNRFLCSQILGAERDTMLLGSRQPSVSSSNPTKTTPGGMLPGGVAVVVAASPGTARAGLGHGARSRAPTPAPAASCSDGAAARGPVQATTGVGLRPGGRRRRSRSLGEVRGPYWRTPARRPWTLSGPWPGGEVRCGTARPGEMLQGDRPAGDAGTESRAAGGTSLPRDASTWPSATTREAQRRRRAFLSRQAASRTDPWVGNEGFTLPNPGQASSRSGEPRPRGLHSLSRLATTGTVDPGAGCTVEARRGGPLLARRARRPTARSEPWGMRRRRVRRTCGRRVHPSPQANAIQRSQRGRRNGPVGAGRQVGCGMY